MKGPFGMLLVGGGIILLVGLFTGKITFPGASSAPALTPAEQSQVQKSTGGTKPDKNGNCPAGSQNLGGVCVPNSVLGQI